MRVIPVIDVMGGQVVRAVGGRRSEYRPIQSRLTDSTEIAAVAFALKQAAQTDEVYVADLDAIMGAGSNREDVCEFARRTETIVWLDAGIRFTSDLTPLHDHRLIRPVVGTETVAGPDVVWAAGGSKSRAAVSLDLRRGQLVGNFDDWRLADLTPLVVAERSVSEGIRAVVVVDVSAVGERHGPPVTGLCSALRRHFPDIELIAGGGVRGWDDIRRLEDAGADGVLVASALHDGTLL